MRKTSIAVALAATLMSACVVGPYDDGYATVVAPPLPLIVELGVDPFYAYGGFHYHYDNGSWRYARNRSGPWIDLPRSHYPRETRYHGPRDRDGDRYRDRDRDRDRDPDRGRRPDRNPIDRP